MRGKRAKYSEGIFGQIKWNMGFKRFLLRGLDKVDLEWGLLCFALNIKRMNKKDIEKLKEEAMAKTVSLSKNIINFSNQKIQLLSSWIFRSSGSYFRIPSLFLKIQFYVLQSYIDLVNCNCSIVERSSIIIMNKSLSVRIIYTVTIIIPNDRNVLRQNNTVIIVVCFL